jgi:hypothetical protein
VRKFFFICLICSAFVLLAHAQDKPANNREIIHEKLKADKKFNVAKYMELTDSEAKRFWPLYDGYQNDLHVVCGPATRASASRPIATAASSRLTISRHGVSRSAKHEQSGIRRAGALG